MKLTLEELRLLKDVKSEEVQKVIALAEKENGYGFELPIMNEILRKAEEEGKLHWVNTQLRYCKYCDKNYAYHTYPRTTRYHRKGDINYDKPIYYSGVEFNPGFVRIKGHGDICWDCVKKFNIINRLIDYIIDNDLPIEIQKNNYRESKYLKDEIFICYQCGKEMQESQMGKLPGLFNGSYPGVCPYCGAKALPFGNNHKTTGKFVMIKNPAFKGEVKSK